MAWEQKRFHKLALQDLCYYEIREQFGLSAQMAIRALGKVADAYTLDKKTKRQFKKHGAFPYDDRILSYRLDDQAVSIWTLNGREIIPFEAGAGQLEMLRSQQGESDLSFVRGEFYLLATCEIEVSEPEEVVDYLGVDLGIANIATTGDGQRYSGKTIQSVRHRHRSLRRKLQKKGTKSAKRLLKHLSGKENRFATDVNHCISKAIVIEAQRTGRGVAIEELTGIRERVRFRKPQRVKLHSWSFAQLGFFLDYKSELYGVPFARVDPRNTSRQCSNPECKHIARANRPNQSTFRCQVCGFSLHADHNAAINIGRRASVNAPHAASDLGTIPA
jgi:IS605 OrfB family transposase